MECVAINIEGKEVLMDDEDFSSLPKGCEFSIDKDGYALIKWFNTELRKRVSSRLHRWVMHEPNGLIVDHINRNRTDNRKSNLRAVTPKQNTQSGGPKVNLKNRTSRFKGVCFSKKTSKWQAGIKVNGKSIYLGQYDTEIEAALAYDKSAKEHFGEYAFTNVA